VALYAKENVQKRLSDNEGNALHSCFGLLSKHTTNLSKERTLAAPTEGSPFSVGKLSRVIEEVDENRSR